MTAATTEYAARIPQGSDLINTTSMCANSRGRPYIAAYWRPEGSNVPQYHLVHHDGSRWRTLPIGRRHAPFSLQGGGTKRIPISRCQILADGRGTTDRAYLLFRDVERDHRVSVAICDDLDRPTWQVRDLTDFSVGRWEPSYDTELWKRAYALHVFVQNVDQGDADRPTGFPPQPVSVLEWKPDPAPPAATISSTRRRTAGRMAPTQYRLNRPAIDTHEPGAPEEFGTPDWDTRWSGPRAPSGWSFPTRPRTAPRSRSGTATGRTRARGSTGSRTGR